MASPFRPATDLMVQYARYHRDRRNIATHLVGIPLIVFSIGLLLSRPVIDVGTWMLTPGAILWGLTTLWYLTRGQLALGLATSAVNFVLIALAQGLAPESTSAWLAAGVGAFVIGWIFQFVGHYYEGRKPAFVDDLVGLLVGPMFVTGEVMFALGWGRDLAQTIEAQAGPTHLRDLTQPAA